MNDEYHRVIDTVSIFWEHRHRRIKKIPKLNSQIRTTDSLDLDLTDATKLQLFRWEHNRTISFWRQKGSRSERLSRQIHHRILELPIVSSCLLSSVRQPSRPHCHTGSSEKVDTSSSQLTARHVLPQLYSYNLALRWWYCSRGSMSRKSSMSSKPAVLTQLHSTHITNQQILLFQHKVPFNNILFFSINVPYPPPFDQRDKQNCEQVCVEFWVLVLILKTCTHY